MYMLYMCMSCVRLYYVTLDAGSLYGPSVYTATGDGMVKSLAYRCSVDCQSVSDQKRSKTFIPSPKHSLYHSSEPESGRGAGGVSDRANTEVGDLRDVTGIM